jgi:hypothetical protein
MMEGKLLRAVGAKDQSILQQAYAMENAGVDPIEATVVALQDRLPEPSEGVDGDDEEGGSRKHMQRPTKRQRLIRHQWIERVMEMKAGRV